MITNFNPRPPRGGRRILVFIRVVKMEFQSTPPARGATSKGQDRPKKQAISIHAPREGGDQQNTHSQQQDRLFQSTPPARGATILITGAIIQPITFQSTPPARGATFIDEVSLIWDNHFNPRPPRGGRRQPRVQLWSTGLFQSTPPARGATQSQAAQPHAPGAISIHAPREGGDEYADPGCYSYGHFNPRPPRGGRQQRCTVLSVNL